MAQDDGLVRRSAHALWQLAIRRVPAWLVLSAAVMTLVAAAGWWWRVQPMAVRWGDVATWVGGAATTLSLLFAAVQVRQARLSAEHGRQEAIAAEKVRRAELARTVSVEPSTGGGGGGTMILYCKVGNSGYLPISDVRVSANVWTSDGPEAASQTASPKVLAPGSEKKYELSLWDIARDMPVFIGLTFIDSWGTRRWQLLDEHGVVLETDTDT